jgi:starvation-inducible DNA-binding protein
MEKITMEKPRMNPTKNDLPLEIRTAMCALLNSGLAHLINLQLCAKQAHWNVKGNNFFQLHKLFDEVYESLNDPIDNTAERIAALGGLAEGTIAAVVSRSKLTPYSLGITSGIDHLETLSSMFATVGKVVRASIDAADEAGDRGTADLFTNLSRELDKQLWFIESHLQG